MGDYEKLPANFMQMDAPEDDSLWELLSVYADGEATPAESAQIESLLRSDSALKREFDFMRLASSFVAAEAEIAPPAELRDRIFAATVARPTLRRRVKTAWANFTSSLTPRYAMAGGLAGAALLTFALWPHTTNTNVNAPQIAQVTQPAPKQIAADAPPVTQAQPAIESANPAAVKLALSNASLTTAKKTPAKPTVITSAVKKSIMTVAPKTTPAVNHVKSAAPKHPATAPSPQPLAPVKPDTSTEVAYSPRPNMDRVNQRPASAVAAPDTNTQTDDQTAETALSPKPVTVALTDAAPKPQHWEGHLKMPTDNARQMTPSFMRQQRQAFNSGYNDQIIRSIRQNQIRIGTELRF